MCQQDSLSSPCHRQGIYPTARTHYHYQSLGKVLPKAMSQWGVDVRVVDIPTDSSDTDISTRDTVVQMIALANTASRSNLVIHVVDSLIKSLPNNPSERDVARAIYNFVRRTVRFKEDEDALFRRLGYGRVDKELLISPDVLLSMNPREGDCDDFSMLVASLLRCVGIHCQFVIICADERLPWKWSHVYVSSLIEGERVAMDASHGHFIGWEYDGPVFRRMEWFIG